MSDTSSQTNGFEQDEGISRPISLEGIERTPHHCVWEITNACNLNCVHCESESGLPRDSELTSAEALSLCESLQEIGCHWVNITGGEPLLRKDWADICRKLVELGMKPILVSNLTCLQKKQITELKTIGIEYVATSIDGPKAVHDRIRCTRSGDFSPYDRTVNTIRRLKNDGFHVSVITHISLWNIEFLGEVLALLEELHVDIWQVQLGFPAGRLKEIAAEYLIRPWQISTVSEFLANARETSPIRIDVADNIGYFGPHEVELRSLKRTQFWQGCMAGYASIYIAADGTVQGCPSLEISVGNIREEPLSVIWNDEERFWYNACWDESELQGFCRGCPYRRICRGGCKSLALSTTGSIHRNIYCENQVLNLNGDPNKREVDGRVLP